MSALSGWAGLFVCMHGALAAAYVAFAGFKRAAELARLAVRHRHLVVAAEALVVLALVAPAAIHTIPQRHLPTVDWSVFERPADGGTRGGRKTARSSRPAAARAAVMPTAHARAEHERLSRSLTQLGWLAVALGLLVMLARLARDLMRLRATLAQATVVRRLGRVWLAVSDSTAVPFSTRGLVRRWVVVPSSLLANAADYRLAVRHELQHHRHGDASWAIAFEFLTCFFFPNPTAFLWKRELMELQEFSCDEALIGHRGVSRHDYGSCLVRVAEAALGRRGVHTGTVCMGTTSRNPDVFKSFLRRRVEMFMTEHEVGRPGTRRWAGVLVGTAAIVFTVLVSFGMEQSLVRAGEPRRVNAGSVVVDPDIQRIAERVLHDALESEQAKAGFAIVADPNTGRILAVANLDRTGKRTGYWSLGWLAEPASIAKSLVVAQALEKGLTTPRERHACENGNYLYGGRVFHDWKKQGWDFLSTADTIALSGDICSIKIGEKLGAEGIRAMLADFGFGPGGTASTFPGARPGELPPANPTDGDAQPLVVPSVSTGFGFQTTPIELVQAYGAIANGGNLLKPKASDDPSPRGDVIRRVLSPESARQMRLVLQQVTLKGTAAGKERGASRFYSTAGKTATSHSSGVMELDWMGGTQPKADLAGFIGFAPVGEPRIEVYVGISEPQSSTGAHGGTHASPVFRQITDEVLQHLGVTPDLPQP